jgi:diguanylate cyclase (GGDEF)-like protein
LITAPKPSDERERLAALARYEVLDSPPERAFDDIVRLASQICGTPVALMGLVDSDRLWYKARIGVPVEETDRDESFCSHTILQDEPLVVSDLKEDERFSDNPNVIGGPRVRFYAGAPLITEDGHALGTLCTLDTVPRTLSDDQTEALAALSRQVVAQLELGRLLDLSREEAMTDPLTGLGNRRRLSADLHERLVTATSEEPLHLFLYDLDGFKQYNDTFGHSAGDTLLMRLSGRLTKAVSDEGLGYRIGGDEFCALVGGDRNRIEAIRGAVTSALTEHGDGFSITASFGAATLPTEATTLRQAYQLADERMYAQKAGRSPAAARQTHDALLRMIDEWDPEMHSHGRAVADLAVAVGRHLDLCSTDLDRLAKAASLHDIGKVAIPRTILDKDGPLNDEEWAFVRTHTELGERIIGEAPALREEAAVVRATHERWDGDGYPDGRAGEEIPLAARIIFACDAFDAMTSVRLYGVLRNQAEAVDELRRCAGSQFDPEVVDALEKVLAVDRSPSSVTLA